MAHVMTHALPCSISSITGGAMRMYGVLHVQVRVDASVVVEHKVADDIGALHAGLPDAHVFVEPRVVPLDERVACGVVPEPGRGGQTVMMVMMVMMVTVVMVMG